MDQTICRERLLDALSKACAARNESIGTAYSDLADFYQRKLIEKAGFGIAENSRCLGLI